MDLGIQVLDARGRPHLIALAQVLNTARVAKSRLTLEFFGIDFDARDGSPVRMDARGQQRADAAADDDAAD